MVLTIAILVTLTVAIAAFVLAPRTARRRVLFDAAPDRPAPFGLKMAWLAIRTQDTARVLDVLGMVDPRPCNWNSGIGTVYDDRLGEHHLFVSPPVDGWTFVVGLSLPYPVGQGFVDKCTPMLLRLGREFGEVQYFFSYPLIDFFAWARIIGGKLVRAFAISDEGTIWNKGKPTKEERSLGLKLFELRGVRERTGDAGGALMLYPTEEHVMRLASRWSLDPTRIDSAPASASTGYICLAPTSWRPERMRKSA
ncbi:MAG TPA: hypothetical protein VF226_22065 [Hyphomicrobiaceae bacterium]